jgi:hypothetical protein
VEIEAFAKAVKAEIRPLLLLTSVLRYPRALASDSDMPLHKGDDIVCCRPSGVRGTLTVSNKTAMSSCRSSRRW